MKLKYALKKAVNLKTGYLIAIVLTLILVIGGYFSYAVFTASSESKGALNIVTGNLYSLITSIDLDDQKSIKIGPNKSKNIELKLTNTNGIKTKVNLYYSSSSSNIEIGYVKEGDQAPTTEGYVLNENGSSGDSKTILVKIMNHDDHEVTVTFGSDAGLEKSELAFPNGKRALSLIEGIFTNSNITSAYEYNEDEASDTYCITGEEETCNSTKCFENESENSCGVGTIIKYRVKDDTEKFFYVLHDDGETLTMQQRENTTDNVVWYDATNDNTKGPITALALLEDATKDWENVNDLDYEMGKTAFIGDNFHTGCNQTDCEEDIYQLVKEKVKARMITIQEAREAGCETGKECPKMFYQYLYTGKREDLAMSQGYWTMTADSVSSSNVYKIIYTGNIATGNLNNTNYGTRAVVVINKK